MHAAGGGKGAKGIVFTQAARGLAVDRQAIDLGYILRQFPDLDFGMDDFGHRLRVQKFVYLLQAFDIYLATTTLGTCTGRTAQGWPRSAMR